MLEINNISGIVFPSCSTFKAQFLPNDNFLNLHPKVFKHMICSLQGLFFSQIKQFIRQNIFQGKNQSSDCHIYRSSFEVKSHPFMYVRN